MPVRIDPRIQTIVNVGAAATKVPAQVVSEPLKPLVQASASGFEAARQVMVNLEGGVPRSPSGDGGGAEEPWRMRVTELTSGWGSSKGVKIMSLAGMQDKTGTYLGHTTPDQAFLEGRWGGTPLP